MMNILKKADDKQELRKLLDNQEERSGIIKTYFIMYNKGRISKEDVLEELQITEEELDEIINNNYK